MILYFMLIDLEDKEIERIIGSIHDKIRMPILLNIVLLKLYYCLHFKSAGRLGLQESIKRSIIKIKTKIDPKTDKGGVKQEIAKEIMLLNRNNKTK